MGFGYIVGISDSLIGKVKLICDDIYVYDLFFIVWNKTSFI